MYPLPFRRELTRIVNGRLQSPPRPIGRPILKWTVQMLSCKELFTTVRSTHAPQSPPQTDLRSRATRVPARRFISKMPGAFTSNSTSMLHFQSLRADAFIRIIQQFFGSDRLGIVPTGVEVRHITTSSSSSMKKHTGNSWVARLDTVKFVLPIIAILPTLMLLGCWIPTRLPNLSCLLASAYIGVNNLPVESRTSIPAFSN